MSKVFHHVQVTIVNNCHSFIGEPLYLLGNFNNWEEPIHVGEVPAIGKEVTLDLGEVKSGDLELKLTRGTWDTVSCDKSGKAEPALRTKIQKDVDLEISIEAWRDEFPKSTASNQVHILDEHFFFPELNVYRKVWIYLPKDYQENQFRYPVFYMHDGQNLFDENLSIGKSGPVEWMVDETLDKSERPAIVVAIDQAKTNELRQQEYLVNPGQGTEKAQGWLYLEDIVNTLKPFIDKNYRTYPDSSNTIMVGSSIGGLLSVYAGLKYPEVFGQIVSFSPSIWMDEENLYEYSKKQFLKNVNARKLQEFYFYIGDREGKFRFMESNHNMKTDLEKYYSWLEEHFPGTLNFDVENEGKHEVLFWQEAFRKFIERWQIRE